MNKTNAEQKGFTLVEMAIVLVIVGLIMATAVTVWRSSLEATKASTTKANMENVKSALVNYAMARGQLPCSDATIPPNNVGLESRNGAGVCSCAAPPCYVPYQTLQLQLPGGKDAYSNAFRFDISYEAAGGNSGGLTNATQDTFCGILYEYMVHAVDAGQLRTPCVTNQNDGNDNGQIGAAGQGYGVAAVIVSQTPVGNAMNLAPGLKLKNQANTPREYEMANRVSGNTYGDLVAELPFGDLYARVCTPQKTKIRIQNYTGTTKYVQLAGAGVCTPINTTTGYVDISQGTTVTFFNDAACTTPCGGAATPITFNMSLTSDAGTVDWNGVGVRGRDGRVQITTVNCTLSNNVNATP